MSKDHNASRLEKLSELQSGWLNGEGNPITCAAIKTAKELREIFIQNKIPDPYLYPTPAGGIQMEWPEYNSEEIEAVVKTNGSICWMKFGITDGIDEEITQEIAINKLAWRLDESGS